MLRPRPPVGDECLQRLLDEEGVAVGLGVKEELGLSETEFGLLIGTPILTGSLIRLILGIWSDQYGGRVVYTLTMLSAAVMTTLLTFAYDYPTFLLAALGVGIAGGSGSGSPR